MHGRLFERWVNKNNYYVLTVPLIQSQRYSIGHKIKGGHVAEI